METETDTIQAIEVFIEAQRDILVIEVIIEAKSNILVIEVIIVAQSDILETQAYIIEEVENILVEGGNILEVTENIIEKKEDTQEMKEILLDTKPMDIQHEGEVDIQGLNPMDTVEREEVVENIPDINPTDTTGNQSEGKLTKVTAK